MNKRAPKKKDNRPKMQRRDVEMQVAVAGHKALQEAAAGGGDPRTVRALIRGAQRDNVGGIEIGAASLNSMVALDRYWSSETAGKDSAILQLVHMSFAYLRPDAALAALEINDAAFVTAAAEFAREVPLAQIREIGDSIRGHIRDLFPQGGAASDAPEGEPPAKPSKGGPRK